MNLSFDAPSWYCEKKRLAEEGEGGVCASTSETHETSRSVRQWWRRSIAAAAAKEQAKAPAFLFFCEILRNLKGAVAGTLGIQTN